MVHLIHDLRKALGVKDLPVVIAGGGQGVLTTGRHHRAAEGTPVGNLWLAVAQAMGSPIRRFADSDAVAPLV